MWDAILKWMEIRPVVFDSVNSMFEKINELRCSDMKKVVVDAMYVPLFGTYGDSRMINFLQVVR